MCQETLCTFFVAIEYLIGVFQSKSEKERILTDMQRAKQEAESRRREQEARDRMDDRLIEVLQRSKARIEARRRQTEKQVGINYRPTSLSILQNTKSAQRSHLIFVIESFIDDLFQIQKEKQEILEKISQRLESGDAERDAREQQMLEKAVKEKEEM